MRECIEQSSGQGMKGDISNARKEGDMSTLPTPDNNSTTTSSIHASTTHAASITMSRCHRILGVLIQRDDPVVTQVKAKDGTPKGIVIPFYLGMIALSILYQILMYQSGMLLPTFYTVFAKRNTSEFVSLMVNCLGYYIAISITNSLFQFMGGLFALNSRRRLVQYIQQRYVGDVDHAVSQSGRSSCKEARTRSLLYDLVHSGQGDNPDQRITTDIDLLTDSLRAILVKVIIVPLLIVYYTRQTVLAAGWTAPAYLSAFFLLSYVACAFAIKPLVGLVDQKERAEGDFRYLHVHLRDHAEPVSILCGQRRERFLLQHSLDALLSFQWRILCWQVLVGFLTDMIDYCGALVSYAVVAVPILSGVYDQLDGAALSTVVSQTVFTSMYLISQLTSIADLSTEFAKTAGYINRVGLLLEEVDLVWDHPKQGSEASIDVVVQNAIQNDDEQARLLPSMSSPAALPISSNDLVISQLSVKRPDISECLIVNLSLRLTKGDHLVITGPSGCGKSSLFRILSGIWPAAAGSIHFPKERPASTSPPSLFIPQASYLIPGGGLVDQLTYPDQPSTVCMTKDRLEELLCAVELQHLQHRANPISASSLSPGEIQRLCLARVLWHRPVFAFMDEATSALDQPTEERILRRLVASGETTLVAISHRPLVGLFKHELRLDRSGWQLLAIQSRPDEESEDEPPTL